MASGKRSGKEGGGGGGLKKRLVITTPPGQEEQSEHKSSWRGDTNLVTESRPRADRGKVIIKLLEKKKKMCRRRKQNAPQRASWHYHREVKLRKAFKGVRKKGKSQTSVK